MKKTPDSATRRAACPDRATFNPRLIERLKDCLEENIQNASKGQNEVGSLARAIIRLKNAGAPQDEIDIVARPFLNAFAAAWRCKSGESEVKIPKDLWSKA